MVDVEVKVMLMQGTYIFKRDRMTQLIRCVPWTIKLCPLPNIIKKMKTFLEVENKMEPVIPAPVSQFRPLLPETNSNIRKSDSTEKRKRAIPKKRFRLATPKATTTCLPLPQTAPRPTNGASAAPVTVKEDTPWPGTCKMSGNLFGERNWEVPKDYLAIEDKKEDTTIAKPPSIEESKMGEQTSSQKEEKCGWGPDCPFCKAQKKDADLPHQQECLEEQQ